MWCLIIDFLKIHILVAGAPSQFEWLCCTTNPLHVVVKLICSPKTAINMYNPLHSSGAKHS